METPKYCKHCGSLLEVKIVNKVQRGYNPYTGKPRYFNITVFRCPNEEKSFSEFDNHDLFEIAEEILDP